MHRPFRTATIAALILSALAAPAWAAPKRMVTYDSASPTAKKT